MSAERLTPKTSIPWDHYLKLRTENHGIVVLTKDETKECLKELLEETLDLKSSESINDIKKQLEDNVSKAFWVIDEQLTVFVNNKIDVLTEKVVDMLLTRKFNEEVEKRVKEELQKKEVDSNDKD